MNTPHKQYNSPINKDEIATSQNTNNITLNHIFHVDAESLGKNVADHVINGLNLSDVMDKLKGVNFNSPSEDKCSTIVKKPEFTDILTIFSNVQKNEIAILQSEFSLLYTTQKQLVDINIYYDQYLEQLEKYNDQASSSTNKKKLHSYSLMRDSISKAMNNIESLSDIIKQDLQVNNIRNVASSGFTLIYDELYKKINLDKSIKDSIAVYCDICKVSDLNAISAKETLEFFAICGVSLILD